MLWFLSKICVKYTITYRGYELLTHFCIVIQSKAMQSQTNVIPTAVIKLSTLPGIAAWPE